MGRKLRAVGPVHLVAVVGGGIVTRGDVDAGGGAVLDDGEGELRRRAQGVEQTDMDAVRGADAGGLHGELLAVVAAVIADDDAPAAGLVALGYDQRGERLGRPAHHMHVHAVEAHAHHAAQAGGAEFQRTAETAFDLVFVVSDGVELLPLRLGEGGAVEPAFIFLPVIHLRRVLLSEAPAPRRAWCRERRCQCRFRSCRG